MHSSRKNKQVNSKYKPRTAAGAYQGLMHKQTAHMSIQHTQVDSTHKSIAQVDRTQVDSTHKQIACTSRYHVQVNSTHD